MKFVFGQKVKISSGFFEGSEGMVVSAHLNTSGEVAKYGVLIIPPDWVSPDLYTKGVGAFREDFEESLLVGWRP